MKLGILLALSDRVQGSNSLNLVLATTMVKVMPIPIMLELVLVMAKTN